MTNVVWVPPAQDAPLEEWRAWAMTLHAENQRLRHRIHEAVDEANRRHARVESEYARLQAEMREAVNRHRAEMAASGNVTYTHINGYGRLTAAAIIGERDALAKRLAKVELDLTVANAELAEWRKPTP